MKVKRNDLNRLIINDFMLNKLPNGYNQNFKNKYVKIRFFSSLLPSMEL